MELAAPILSIVADLFDCTTEHVSYVHGLRENLDCLRKEMELLSRISDDVERRVELAKQHWMAPSREVEGWIQDVHAEKNEVSAILQQGDALLAKRCPARSISIGSIYKLGKRVSPRIERVKELRTRGDIEAVAFGVPCAALEELPLGDTMGLDSLYEQVCSCLADDEVGIVGLYGRRGIGKTTLLKKINNGVQETDHHFDFVIWVTVEKTASEKAAQQVIGNKLQIIDNIWPNRSQVEKAIQIVNILKTKRFLLLLDDVPYPLDLSAIGVPLPDHRNRSKVIITSRLHEICILMKAVMWFEVKPLAGEYAWPLFLKQLHRNTRDVILGCPEIEILANNLLARCEGLPSAIIKAGLASAMFTTITPWQQSEQELKDLISEEISVKDRLSHPVSTDEMPVGYTVGLEALYVRVLECLVQSQPGIVGLYGIGGVGKTTLMKKLYNEFIKTSNSFDAVIWVTMSKQENVGAAQEVIRNKLRIPNRVWESRTVVEKSIEIFNTMKRKRVLLLLDDVWQRIDLLEIGVPLRQIGTKSKVIITTKFQKICNEMEVPSKSQFRVEFLTQEDASALFLQNIGESTLNSHPDIPQLVDNVVARCKGLPLALITIGRAMANRNSPEAWDRAVQELEKSPVEISSTELDKVFHVLKLSYDSLKDDIIKSCFIYYSSFPKGYEINNDELIEHWIGEGFVDGRDIHEARRRGYKIIEDLKDACLVEEGDAFKECIKMHDMVHDMVLWIAQECGKKINKILVYESLEFGNAKRSTYWQDAKTISLWGTNIKELPEAPNCSNLQTLFVRECTQLKTFPREFFQFMPLLRVMDLSFTHGLTELPDDIDRLMSLEYINLSMTSIRELPTKMMSLKRLRCLLLNGICPLIIPPLLISHLSSLQLFSMYDGYALAEDNAFLLKELEFIECLDELSLSFRSVIALNKLQTSQKLQRCIRRLSICDCEDLLLLKLSSISLNCLEVLVIFNCLELEETKINVEKEGREGFKQTYDIPNLNLIVRNNQHFHRLHDVEISNCPKLLNLTWLVYATYLQSLDVHHCKSMERVIGDEYVTSTVQNVSIFTRLRFLVLGALPSLENIFQGALLFPSLEVMSVINCPSLGRLPFDPNGSPKSLKKIEGDLTWWESLQWDEEYMEDLYVVYFSPQYLADPVHLSGEEKKKKEVVTEGSTSTSTA